MSCFDAATLQFLQELAANNDRAWFAANKQRYDEHVLAPSLELIRAMAPALARISPHFAAKATRMGGSLMRVQRDTRFARDKSPFKTNIGIQFRHKRGKDVHVPGFYVHVEPGNCFLGAGIWHPEPRALAAIRMEIAGHPELWQRVRGEIGFRSHFELAGSQLERMPRGFAADAPHAEDLRRKDFVAVSTVGDGDVIAAELPKVVAARFAAAAPLVQFLCHALDLEF